MHPKKKMNPIVEGLIIFSIFVLTGWGFYAFLQEMANVMNVDGSQIQSIRR